MFILDVSKKTKNGISPCRLLVDSYRDKNGVPRHNTLVNLSKLPPAASFAIEKLVEKKKINKTPVYLEDITKEDNRSLGEVTVLKRLADKTGVTKILEKYLGKYICSLVLAMSVNRISLPKSRYSLCDWLETTYLPELLSSPDNKLTLKSFHYNKLYSALKILEKKQVLIENDLWKKTREKEKGITLMLYDITSAYLEGWQNQLAAFGYNRDKKKGKKQIVVALTTTKRGRPVSVETLKGNTTDKTTLLSKVDEIEQRFKINNIIYVFDRGMKDEKKLAVLQAKKVKYITALSRSEIKKLKEKNQHIQLSLFDSKIAEYQIQEKIQENRKNNKNKKKMVAKRYIICKSDQEKKNKRKREILIQKTEEELEKIKTSIKNKRLKDPLKISARAERWLSRWKMKKYFEIKIKERYFDYQRKKDVIETTEILDGIYVLETNVKKETISAKEVQTGYKNLYQVENNFRIIKSNLNIRPVNHRLKETTKGHIFICFLALYIRKEMELLLKPLLKNKKRKNLTFDKIQIKLRKIRQVLLQAGKYQTTVINNNLDNLQKDILKTLKIRVQPIPLIKTKIP